MDFIDMHIHLQDYKSNNAKDIISNAQKKGAKRLVCASASQKDWAIVSEIATSYSDFVVPCFGVLPHYVDDLSYDWQDKLASYLSMFSTSLVGESGLDKQIIGSLAIEKQQEIFVQQIDLAKDFCRPLVVHAVRADFYIENLWAKMPCKFMLHSFNGSLEFMQKIIKNGGHVSFSASITKNKNFIKIMEQVPTNKILVETDGPYQSGTKDKESNPIFIPELIEAIAQIKKIAPQDLAKQIYNNSMEFIYR